MKNKIQKVCKILLVILLVIGLLSSSFGVAIAAITDQGLHTKDATNIKDKDSGEGEGDDKESSQFVSPIEQYGGTRDGEAALSDNVQILSDADAETLKKAFVSTETVTDWSETYSRYNFNIEKLIVWPEELPDEVLNPKPTEPIEWPDDLTDEEMEELRKQEEKARQEEQERLEKIEEYEDAKRQAIDDAKQLLAETVTRARQRNSIYIPADKNDTAGDRIYTIKGSYCSNYSETAYLDLREATFEEAFTSMDICASEVLNKDNLVNASFAPGVSATFGDTKITPAIQESTPTVNNLSARNTPVLTDSQGDKYSTEDGNLKVNLDYKLKGEEKDGVETEMKLTGSFEIKDLQAHMVCRVEDVLDIQELYFGLSGQLVTSVTFTGSVKGEAKPEATKTDVFGLFDYEGLDKKRFPIAVFQFKGTTPVYITNEAFEASQESLLPNLFVILYADWQGSISVELTSTVKYTDSFNSGLRVFRNGEADLGFEEYPYPTAPDEQVEDGFSWETTVTIEAQTDVTLFGGSVLFYIGGINLAEVGIAKIGVEAKCNLTATGSIDQKLQVSGDTDAYAYIRGYLKFLEVNIKLKVDGGLLFKNLSTDMDLQFCLLNLTLFTWGKTPDEFKNKTPVSTMVPPEEFASVMCLVCDVSGSMGEYIGSGQTKLEAAKEAAATVTNAVKAWGTQNSGNYGVGVVQFSDDASNLVLPHIDYTYIQDYIGLMGGGGGTNIHAGIDVGTEQLKNVTAENKVIILMTDGQDYDETAILASAQAAADAGIAIYTIGFGDGVNEDLLTKVAETANGEYSFANTNQVTSIMGSFIRSQQSAEGADVLTEMESTVGEGELSEKTDFTVEDESGKLVVTTAWPGSFLDTILVDPLGREVDENYPGATTDESQIPSTIVVNDPIPGEWSVQVLGVETSYEQEPFYTLVAFTGSSDTTVNDEMTDLQKIAAWCLPIGVAVTMASAMALIGLGKAKKEEIPAE